MVEIYHKPENFINLKPEFQQMNNIMESYLNGLKNCIDEIIQQDVSGVAEVIYQAYLKNKQIFIFGNGGSAATAAHMVCDFKKGTCVPGKPRLRVIGLTDNIPLLTAVANDINYESVFVEQLISQIGKGDVAIGISCSGNSSNVIKGIAYAKECGAITIGFTAFGGGKLKNMVDKCITLTCQDFGQAEDIHLSLDHILTNMIKARMMSEWKSAGNLKS